MARAALALLCFGALLASSAVHAFNPYWAAQLQGANEVGGVGDATAIGTAWFQTFGAAHNAFTLKFQLTAQNLTGPAPPTAAHIHNGTAGTDGGVVLVFSGAWRQQNGLWILAGQYGNTDALTNAANQTYTQVLRAVMANPAQYYANIHTSAHPAGAARGQLFYYPILF